MTAMPSTPVKRPMRSTSRHSSIVAFGLASVPASALPADRTPNQHRFEMRFIRLYAIARRDHRLGVFEPSAVIVMNRDQRRSLLHTIADAPVKFERDAVVDRAFFRLAPTA